MKPPQFAMKQGENDRIMNVRRLAALVVLIVAGFWYVTTFGIPGAHELQQLAHHDLPSLAHNVHLDHSVELTEADAQSSYDSVEQNNIAVYKRVLPAVVNITSTAVAYDWFWGAVPQQGQGSGFIVDSHGHILTNYHVIEGGSQIEVTLSNKHKYKAQVVLTDKPHDLALLQIDAPDLTPAVLSNSQNLQVGQKVYAIGNPFGLERHHDDRHHQRAALRARAGGQPDRERHPDGCGDQPGQLRRPAAELAWRSDRDQLADRDESE